MQVDAHASPSHSRQQFLHVRLTRAVAVRNRGMSNNSDVLDEIKVTGSYSISQPADASLTVDLPEPVKQNLKVSLCSQYGQEVKSAVIVKGEHKSISIQDL